MDHRTMAGAEFVEEDRLAASQYHADVCTDPANWMNHLQKYSDRRAELKLKWDDAQRSIKQALG